MAAGRHGGYRDNEFRDRESDIVVSTRRDIYYSKDIYDRFINGDRKCALARVLERVKERDIRDSFTSRENDVKQREVVNGGYNSCTSITREKDVKVRKVVNGGYYSSSSTSTSGSRGSSHRRGAFSASLSDREPGELSSGSGSDYAIAFESTKDIEVSKSENVIEVPGKKRKISPIIWDREEKDLINSFKSRAAPTSHLLHPSPPLPESFGQMPHLIPEGIVRSSPTKPYQLQSLQPFQNNPLALSLPVASISNFPAGLSSRSPQEQCWSNDQDPSQPEENDFFPERKISASRWAVENDEGASSDDDSMPKRRKNMSNARLKTKALSPELGEIIGGDSEGARSKSSESEGDRHVGPSGEDEFSDNELDRNDFIETDGNDAEDGANVCHLDTDSGRESDSHMITEPNVPPLRSINMLQGCRSVQEFEKLNKIDEGTYGVVYRARDKKTGEIVALKKVKMEKEREGFPLTSLREINILLSFHHPYIVDVKEVVVEDPDSVFMVMEYMEHDLKGLMESMKQPFSQSEVKCLMLQLLEGVKYLHDNWVLHRDLKTSNLLLNNRGELKICDFGLSRQYGFPLKPYTPLVVTLWYRAPELLLGAKQYSTAIDMWSLGCIMAELLAKQPLFSGKTELDQLDKIFRTLGTPNETIWQGFSKLPGLKVNHVKHQYNLLRKKFPATSFTGSPILSESGFDLLSKLLTYDPEKRITAEAALNHEWFREVPLPKSKDFMPTFPAQHAQDRHFRRMLKSPDSLQKQWRKELQQRKLGTGGLFGL